MKLPNDLKNLLLRVRSLIPVERQEQFARNIRSHFESVEMDDLAGCAIAGALIGSLCELLPLDTITGVDDWVEIGAALGASVGYARSAQERKLRREVQSIIEQEIRRAVA